MSTKVKNIILEQGHLYHIFNQGNNRRKIFFKRENYFFFLKKINTYILPYADVIAWCLMPNHFHLMVYVNFLEVNTDRVTPSEVSGSATMEYSHPMTPIDALSNNSGSATLSRAPTTKVENFNQAIGILLASYTRAINKQENISGSLFRSKTKAQCLTKSKGVTPAFYNTSSGTKINVPITEREYPQLCFNYVHDNPVKAGLVRNAEDWEFSSYCDYCGLRDGKLINRDRAEEFGLKV